MKPKIVPLSLNFHQTGDRNQYSQEITFYSAYGWVDTDSGEQVQAFVSSEDATLPGSLSYTTKNKTSAITVLYVVKSLNPDVESTIETTFNIYKNGELIDTHNVSYNNEDNLSSLRWKYFSDVSDE